MSKYELALVVNAKIEDEAREAVVEKAKGRWYEIWFSVRCNSDHGSSAGQRNNRGTGCFLV